MTGQERIDRMCVTFGLEGPFAPHEGRDTTMASQTGQSSILAKLGKRGQEVAANHATKEPELPNMSLPAGIENGIAQVVDCKFGIVEAGKPKAGAMFFMAQGIVKEPPTFKGLTIAGRRTMIYKEVADAKGVPNDKNLQWAQDQLKILVGKNADPTMFHLDKMESTAALLRKAKPHTAFRTWKGDKQDVRQVEGKWFLCNLTEEGEVKNVVTIQGVRKGPYPSEAAARAANKYAGNEPMVNNQWCGAVTYAPPSPNGQVVDESPPADEPSTSSEPTGHDDADTSGASFDEFQQPETASGEEDLDAIAAEAYKNAEAQQQLERIAVEAGIDSDTVNAAQAWEDVVKMIREAREAGSAATEEGSSESPAEESWTPEKGEVCYYYPKLANGEPVRGKNKKPLRSEVVVLTSDKRSSTATLQDNATKKPILGTNKKPLLVKWDDLAVE